MVPDDLRGWPGGGDRSGRTSHESASRRLMALQRPAGHHGVASRACAPLRSARDGSALPAIARARASRELSNRDGYKKRKRGIGSPMQGSHRSRFHAVCAGAIIGYAIALVMVLGTDSEAAGYPASYWPLTQIALGTLVGAVIGLLISEIPLGRRRVSDAISRRPAPEARATAVGQDVSESRNDQRHSQPQTATHEDGQRTPGAAPARPVSRAPRKSRRAAGTAAATSDVADGPDRGPRQEAGSAMSEAEDGAVTHEPRKRAAPRRRNPRPTA
jgi:hypothetical protein